MSDDYVVFINFVLFHLFGVCIYIPEISLAHLTYKPLREEMVLFLSAYLLNSMASLSLHMDDG